jgi:hypothetical protein
MADSFEPLASALNSPVCDGAAVVKSDETVIPTTRAIYVGGEGNLSVVMKCGATLTFQSVAAGSLLPIRVSKVLAATTATNILALW